VTIEAPERRVFEAPLQLRDTQLVGKPYKFLEGRAVPYDEWASLGWFLEQHQRGSLDLTTTAGTGKALPLLLFHNNRAWPVGHAESWTSPEDGLHGVWRLNDTADAQQAASLCAAGDLCSLSIGFSPIRSAWEYVDDWNPELGPDHMDRVTRLESRLLEVSLTPTPAFAGAEVSMVRTAERPRPRGLSRADGWKRELEKLRR
jgi:HK97 family phage prohead protease